MKSGDACWSGMFRLLCSIEGALPRIGVGYVYASAGVALAFSSSPESYVTSSQSRNALHASVHSSLTTKLTRMPALSSTPNMATSDPPADWDHRWLFTEDELHLTPSALDGYPLSREREERSKGCNFIVQLGIQLKLPQLTLATASTYLHRFYMQNSLKRHHYYVTPPPPRPPATALTNTPGNRRHRPVPRHKSRREHA